MRKILIVFSFLWIPHLYAAQLHKHTALTDALSVLTLYGAANYSAIQPIINEFQKTHPTITLTYTEFSSLELYEFFLNNPNKRPDLMLSPAMDLQIKLVNDGYAQSYQSAITDQLPVWAKWRNEIFGFTYEPIVIAINTDILAGAALPQSRDQLLNLIKNKDHLLDGKIGLSDIETVGLGYLTWFHDSQQSRTYGRLLETFGSHHAKLYPNSTAMLQALTKGEIFIAYNVLGSYTNNWSQKSPWITAVLPSDYTSVIMRTAFIPKSAQNLNEAKAFLDFLLSVDGQRVLAKASSLTAINPNFRDSHAALNIQNASHSILRPIPLGLELLIQTDQAKRELLLNEWRDAMRHHTP